MKTVIRPWLLVATFASVCGLVLPGCPDNPYSADTWIEQLDDPKEMERAVTELEHLCDPKAIPALGAAWDKNNQPTRLLQVIIDLSRSLTATDNAQKCPAEVAPGTTGFCADPANANKVIPGEAEEKFCTDFVAKGRPAGWDKAIPFLKKALEEDLDSQRKIDGAVKAAEALGDARADAVKKNDEVALKQLEEGGAVQILIDAVNKKMSMKDAAQRVRLVAVAALGKYKDAAATSTLAAVIKADKDTQPPPLVGASINALGEMRSEQSMPILIEAMYRQPFFFQQTQRALVASGAAVKGEMRKILQSTPKTDKSPATCDQAQVKELLADTSLKLMKWCGADGKLPASECKDVAPLDYYAAMVVGGLYDDEAVDDLVKALDKPATPAYYDNQGNPGPPAQNAILDALRKIGSPKAATKVLGIFAETAKGKAADLNLRILAANVYGFVSPDGKETFAGKTGLSLLVACAKKNDEVEGLRLACAESLGRLVTASEDAQPLRELAAKYANASQEKRKEADGKPKTDLDALQKKLDELNKELKEADTELKKATLEKGDIGLVDKAITERRGKAQAAVDFLKKCPEYDVKAKETKEQAAERTKKEDADKKAGCGGYTDAKIKFDDLDSYAGFMKNFERGFENHLARVEIATRCAGKPDCYMQAFDAKPDDVFAKVKAQNSKPIEVTAGKDNHKASVVLFADAKEWGDGDKADLTQAQIERAVLDMRRLGSAASGQVTVLLQKLNDKRFLEDRLIRQAIMLALPRIAKLPCDQCKIELEKLAKAGQGKAELNALNYETQLAISYFTWAGK